MCIQGSKQGRQGILETVWKMCKWQGECEKPLKYKGFTRKWVWGKVWTKGLWRQSEDNWSDLKLEDWIACKPNASTFIVECQYIHRIMSEIEFKLGC